MYVATCTLPIWYSALWSSGWPSNNPSAEGLGPPPTHTLWLGIRPAYPHPASSKSRCAVKLPSRTVSRIFRHSTSMFRPSHLPTSSLPDHKDS